MIKITFKLIVVLISILLSVASIDAQELNFNDFLTSAINNSYKLQTSLIDTKITKHGVKEAKSAYYPTLSGYATTERYNDLTDGRSQITAVGNEIFLNRNYYQDMAALGVSYNIFDFGARRKSLDIAKFDDEQKELIFKKDTRDLKLDSVDVYAEALNLYKRKNISEEILELQNNLVEINKRLKKAGEVTEIDVVESEITSSETKTELDEIKNNLAKKLTQVSYYTKQEYNIKDISFLDFPENLITPEINNKFQMDENGVIKLSIEENQFDYNNSFEAKVYDLEINKKQKEYQIQKKANFPKIRFDTRYNLYGSDSNNFFDGINDISQRSFSFRLSTSFTLFDGFKNINTIHKKKFEVEKLKVEKEREIADLKKKCEQITLDFKNAIVQSENNKRTLELVDKNLTLLKRLNAKGLIAKSECIKKQLELLKKKQVLEENQIRNFAARYKMMVLSESEVKL